MHSIHTFSPLPPFLHAPARYFPGLSTPKGLRFSEVSDSSAVVHWSSPRAPVDSYRVTYMPFEGGERTTAGHQHTAGHFVSALVRVEHFKWIHSSLHRLRD